MLTKVKELKWQDKIVIETNSNIKQTTQDILL